MLTLSNTTFKCPKSSGHSELSCLLMYESIAVMVRECIWDLGYGFGLNPLSGSSELGLRCFKQQVKINTARNVNIFINNGEVRQSFP